MTFSTPGGIAFSLLTSVIIKVSVLCIRKGETCSGGMFGSYVTSKTFNFYEAWHKIQNKL